MLIDSVRFSRERSVADKSLIVSRGSWPLQLVRRPMREEARVCRCARPLLDYLVESASDHSLFRKAIDQARTRHVPGLVLAEVDCFLRDERQGMQLFMQDLARGAFTYAPPTLGQLTRAMEVDRRFADLRLGLVDASVVAARASLRRCSTP